MSGKTVREKGNINFIFPGVKTKELEGSFRVDRGE